MRGDLRANPMATLVEVYRDAAFAGDQAEHEAKLVGRIALRRRQHRQLALQYRLSLRRPAETRQRRGIGAHIGVAGALSLETLHVAAERHQLGFAGLARPMMALHSNAQEPAQFVFDRGALSGQPGLLAAVVSACQSERDDLTQSVQAQVCKALGLNQVTVVQTVVEKRATLACTAGLNRPESSIADGLWACGDYIQGPYPSTLEGAVRSGQHVVTQLDQVRHRQRLR